MGVMSCNKDFIKTFLDHMVKRVSVPTSGVRECQKAQVGGPPGPSAERNAMTLQGCQITGSALLSPPPSTISLDSVRGPLAHSIQPKSKDFPVASTSQLHWGPTSRNLKSLLHLCEVISDLVFVLGTPFFSLFHSQPLSACLSKGEPGNNRLFPAS